MAKKSNLGKQAGKVADQKEEVATPVASKATPAAKKEVLKAGNAKDKVVTEPKKEVKNGNNKRSAPETKEGSAKNQKTNQNQTPKRSLISVKGCGETDPDILKTIFSDFGEIVNFKSQGKGSKKKILIEFSTPKAAEEALSKDGTEFTEAVHRLTVKPYHGFNIQTAQAEERLVSVKNIPSKSQFSEFLKEHTITPSDIKFSDLNKGAAYLEFKDRTLVLKAINILHKAQIGDRQLRAKIAEPHSTETTKKLNVSNLSKNVTVDILKKSFEKFGCSPSYARIVEKDGKDKSQGFVIFKTHQDAVKALKHEGANIDGLPIELKLDQSLTIPF